MAIIFTSIYLKKMYKFTSMAKILIKNELSFRKKLPENSENPCKIGSFRKNN